MINNSGNGTTGRLYNRFRYLRKLDRDVQMKQNTPNSSGATTNETRTNTISHSIDDLLFLKTVVVSANTIDGIRQRLEMTRKKRDEMVKEDTIDYLEHFPFFFTYPNLVRFLLILNFLFQRDFSDYMYMNI